MKKLGLGHFGIIYSVNDITVQLYSPTIPKGAICEVTKDDDDVPLKKGDKVTVVEYFPEESVEDHFLQDTYWIDDWYMVRSLSGDEYGIYPENLKRI